VKSTSRPTTSSPEALVPKPPRERLRLSHSSAAAAAFRASAALGVGTDHAAVEKDHGELGPALAAQVLEQAPPHAIAGLAQISLGEAAPEPDFGRHGPPDRAGFEPSHDAFKRSPPRR